MASSDWLVGKASVPGTVAPCISRVRRPVGSLKFPLISMNSLFRRTAAARSTFFAVVALSVMQFFIVLSLIYIHHWTIRFYLLRLDSNVCGRTNGRWLWRSFADFSSLGALLATIIEASIPPFRCYEGLCYVGVDSRWCYCLSPEHHVRLTRGQFGWKCSRLEGFTFACGYLSMQIRCFQRRFHVTC